MPVVGVLASYLPGLQRIDDVAPSTLLDSEYERVEEKSLGGLRGLDMLQSEIVSTRRLGSGILRPETHSCRGRYRGMKYELEDSRSGVEQTSHKSSRASRTRPGPSPRTTASHTSLAGLGHFHGALPERG